ncbi:MAG: SRPBCC domain-containing protein [Flavisolibacter sp.]
MNALPPLQIKASLKIQKPVQEVFEAIADPSKMSHYFISKSSGRMEEGKTLIWQFPEMDMQIPVRIQKIEKDRFLSFEWDDVDGSSTLVTLHLEPIQERETFVRITEGTKEGNEAGIAWLQRNTEGWANFLACLKAWLEYGINLRKGAFDPSQMPV